MINTKTNGRKPQEGKWTTPGGKYTVEKRCYRRGDNLWTYAITNNETRDMIEFPAVSEYIRRCSTETDIAQRWGWKAEERYTRDLKHSQQDTRNRVVIGVQRGYRAA